MTIDLTPGIHFIETRMVDMCVVQRDVSSNYDEVLDPETLDLVPPAPQYKTIYSGKCNMTTLREQEHITEQGSRFQSLRTYRVLIPFDVVGILVGDIFMLTGALADTQVVGRPMPILDVDSRSLPTYRRFVCEDPRSMVHSA